MEPVPTIFADKEHIPVFQDESIFHTNEYRCHVWVKDGQQPLKRKGNGQAIHVLDFITECGRLVLTDEEHIHNNACPADMRIKPDARVIIYPGKGHDAWWDGQQLVDQVCSLIYYQQINK